MKISEASIIIKADGFNRLVEFPEIPMVELIAELFKIYGAETEIPMPDHVRDRIKEQVRKDWYKCKLDISQDAYCKLAEEKEIDKYFSVQRAHKAFNDYVLSLNPSPAPELFPGTADALNDLTIRKDENTAI